MSDDQLSAQDAYFFAAQEDRSAPRTRISIPATLRISGARGFQSMIHDLSLSGFCAAAVSRLHPGTVCWLTLPGLEALQARIVWWDNSLAGCAFEQMLSPIVYESLLERWRSNPSFRPIS